MHVKHLKTPLQTSLVTLLMQNPHLLLLLPRRHPLVKIPAMRTAPKSSAALLPDVIKGWRFIDAPELPALCYLGARDRQTLATTTPIPLIQHK
jgi:hypothetical protein